MKVIDRICVPIFGSTADEMISAFEKLPPECSFVELRIDSLAELKVEAVEKVLSAWSGRSIVTCRLERDHGQYLGDIEKRNEVLQACFSLTSTHVDIELEQVASSQFPLKQNLDKLLISYHDFVETPSLEQLHSIIEQMKTYSPAVCKIATQVLGDADISRLYSLLCNKEDDQCELIVIGMGARGRSTRTLAPFLGSYASFSQPIGIDIPRDLGQLTAAKMLELVKAIS